MAIKSKNRAKQFLGMDQMTKITIKLYIFFFLLLFFFSLFGGDHGPPWSPLPPSLSVPTLRFHPCPWVFLMAFPPTAGHQFHLPTAFLLPSSGVSSSFIWNQQFGSLYNLFFPQTIMCFDFILILCSMLRLQMMNS
jgi:hypothetical protein